MKRMLNKIKNYFLQLKLFIFQNPRFLNFALASLPIIFTDGNLAEYSNEMQRVALALFPDEDFSTTNMLQFTQLFLEEVSERLLDEATGKTIVHVDVVSTMNIVLAPNANASDLLRIEAYNY